MTLFCGGSRRKTTPTQSPNGTSPSRDTAAYQPLAGDEPPPYDSKEPATTGCFPGLLSRFANLFIPDKNALPTNFYDMVLCEEFGQGNMRKGWLRIDRILADRTGLSSAAGVSMDDLRAQPWFATFTIVAKDLPALMRDGFHWDQRNIQENRCSVVWGTGILRGDSIYDFIQFTRRYWLSDTNERPTWIGCIEVYAKDIPTLGRFRLRDLVRENIYRSIGQNSKRERVWEFNYPAQESELNTLGENFPMGGWWPGQRGGDNVHSEETARAKP